MKTLKILITTIVLFSIAAEFGSPILYKSVNKRPFYKESIQDRLKRGVSQTQDKINFHKQFKEANFIKNKSLHPYLGYVIDITEASTSANSAYYGFWEVDDRIFTKDDTKFRIGITGGSFAWELVRFAKQTIIDRLKNSPKLKGKEIEVYCLAISGYKQPQQLMTANYFLSLGAKLDMLVNLDGFNDICMPVVDNWQRKVAPSYPRLWNLYARKSLDKNVLDKLVAIENKRNSREKINKFFNQSFLPESSFFLFLWDNFEQRLLSQELALNNTLDEILSQKTMTYQTSGPVDRREDWQEILTDSINLWRRSSSMMNQLCKASGIEYLHFLQPNQYVPGTKMLSEEEQKVAFETGPYAYKTVVEKGYPLLVEQGERLNSNGDFFFDLTNIFIEIEETLYRDKCCHVNEKGYQITAEQIARQIHNIIP